MNSDFPRIHGLFLPYFLRNLCDLVRNDAEVSREKRVKRDGGDIEQNQDDREWLLGRIQDDIESCPTYRTHRRGEISPPPDEIARSYSAAGGKGAGWQTPGRLLR